VYFVLQLKFFIYTTLTHISLSIFIHTTNEKYKTDEVPYYAGGKNQKQFLSASQMMQAELKKIWHGMYNQYKYEPLLICTDLVFIVF
jgi:hypothetical protein